MSPTSRSRSPGNSIRRATAACRTADDITNVTQPDFFGTFANRFSHVSLFANDRRGWDLRSDRHGTGGQRRIVEHHVRPWPWPTALHDHGHRDRSVRRDHHDRPDRDHVQPADRHGRPGDHRQFFNRLNGEVDFTIQDPSPARATRRGSGSARCSTRPTTCLPRFMPTRHIPVSGS